MDQIAVARNPIATETASAPASHAHANGPSIVAAQTFSSLRHRDYRLLWFGTLFMSAGQWIQQVTIGWLLYDMTGSPILLGALNGLRSLPFVISGPLAGVAADRMDRRKLMLAVEPVLVLSALVMGWLIISGLAEVWHLFAFTLITAIAWSFNQPVRQTLIPNLVPRHDLMNALALSSMGMNFMKILGPALGGALIVLFGAGGNFLLQGAVYGGLIGMVFLMRAPPTPPHARQSSALSNFKEGLRYVRSTPLVMALIVAALVPQVFSFPLTQALMPIFQKDVLKVGPEGLGFLLASSGLGAMLATFAIATFGNRIERKGALLIAGLLALGTCMLLLSIVETLPLAMLALVGIGASQMVFMTTANTALQVIVPDELRGRVMSIWMLDHGLSPAGALLAGVMAQIMGAPFTVAFMGGIVLTLAIALVWLAPRLRQLAF